MTATSIAEAGDSGVLVRFEQEMSVATFERVMAALRALDDRWPPGVVDVMPGYASLLVVFDPRATSAAALRPWLQAALSVGPPAATSARQVEIPVLYDAQVAPDLEALAADKGLAVGELVARHTAPRYRCHMLGFRPGFPFLGGLDPALFTPRLATPRPQVAPGSVAIAGRQTGVYPGPGPGGWRIIGRTPLQLFDRRRDPSFLLAPGDLVSFVAIDRPRFLALGGQLPAPGA